jgi:hypothetical protein
LLAQARRKEHQETRNDELFHISALSFFHSALFALLELWTERPQQYSNDRLNLRQKRLRLELQLGAHKKD